MPFYTYVLRLSDGRYYVGHTDALEARIAAHQMGLGSRYTRRRRPVRLVWSDEFATRDEALSAERQLKRWSRAKKEALIAGDWSRLHWLAMKPRERPGSEP
jgi:predicted GIY-YIG superfamily endonuclease